MRLLLSSPVGPLLVEYEPDGVHEVRFWPRGEHPPAGTRDEPARDDELGGEVARQIREYFGGERLDFDLPLATRGTAFQNRVWDALRRIPSGEVRSYAAVAAEVGSPKAVRAVGQANRANRLPILIPCHRVVASGGGLGGYAGSESGAGVEVKRWLLRLEAGMMNNE